MNKQGNPIKFFISQFHCLVYTYAVWYFLRLIKAWEGAVKSPRFYIEVTVFMNDNGGEGTRAFEFHEGVEAEGEDGTGSVLFRGIFGRAVPTSIGIGATARKRP